MTKKKTKILARSAQKKATTVEETADLKAESRAARQGMKALERHDYDALETAFTRSPDYRRAKRTHRGPPLESAALCRKNRCQP